MRQQQLFRMDVPPKLPAVEIPGFSIRPNYLSPGEEEHLIAQVDSGPWQADLRRRIQQYGLGYSSEHGDTPTWLRDFPAWLIPLATRVAADAALDRFPENCVVNEYIPPVGIGPHRDYDAFGPTVACVSLGSDIIMDFVEPARGLRVPVHVPRRSFWVITGEARSLWQHGIAARLTDIIDGERCRRERRISITFRTARDPRFAANRPRYPSS
jgi:alkylated DNA repair dioxygenase AlkB